MGKIEEHFEAYDDSDLVLQVRFNNPKTLLFNIVLKSEMEENGFILTKGQAPRLIEILKKFVKAK